MGFQKNGWAMEEQKRKARSWFRSIQDQICNTISIYEEAPWEVNTWDHGEYRMMHGRWIEKGGVAWSNVSGSLPEEIRNKMGGSTFWSSGCSVVLHTWSPRCPGMHFNTRYIVTDNKVWFGGGMDITPYVDDLELVGWYHDQLRAMCDTYDPQLYTQLSKKCDDYFYLPHRNEHRGAGGIFFDYQDNGFDKDFEFIQDVGKTFCSIMNHLISSTRYADFTDKDKEAQLIKRGRYAEFNLLYDRGTRFGLQSGGNVDAIMMSLPPNCKWP